MYAQLAKIEKNNFFFKTAKKSKKFENRKEVKFQYFVHTSLFIKH